MPHARRWWTYALTAVGVVIALISLFPYLIMVVTSLKSNGDLYHLPATILPTHWTWSNYVNVWSAEPVGRWLWNSIFISVVATAVTLAFAVPAAYYLARHEFKAKKAVMMALLLSQMVTPTVVLIGLYREFLVAGLINTTASIIVTCIGFGVPFAVWMLTSFFRSVPLEISEAAVIDGCNDVGALVRVIMPIAAPGLVTAATFTFVSVWNEYVVALLLINDPTKLPLSVGITAFTGEYEVQWQYLFATGVIAIVPVVVMFAAIERHLVDGLSAGAVR